MAKSSVVALLLTVVAACAAEPTVTEERLPGGSSVIKITAEDGRELASYRINLSTHHYPAASADDPRVTRFRSWRFGAFLCFNSNQYSGQEFSFEPVSAQAFRLNITEATDVPTLWEFQLLPPTTESPP